MSLNTWQETLVSAQVAGTAFNTFTTAKSIIPAQALWTMTPNYLSIGKIFRVRVIGSISNIATTPGTIVFQVMVGAVIAFTTGVIQMSTTVHTTVPFWLEILLTCRAIGSGTSANFMGQGVMQSQAVLVSGADLTTHGMLLAPNSAPAVGTGFDSTVSNVIDHFGGFSISNVGNQVQVQQYTLESLN